jgi:PTS system nitrogen regulatory IIA component
MEIKDFLSPDDVAIDVRAHDKAALLEDLAARAARALDLPAELLAHEIVKRDELGSTGIGGGVSIPHARFSEVTKPFGLLVRLEQPIGFDAVDGQAVDLAFLLILPASSQPDQTKALAAVAHKLREPGVLNELRSAGSARDLYLAVTN